MVLCSQDSAAWPRWLPLLSAWIKNHTDRLAGDFAPWMKMDSINKITLKNSPEPHPEQYLALSCVYFSSYISLFDLAFILPPSPRSLALPYSFILITLQSWESVTHGIQLLAWNSCSQLEDGTQPWAPLSSKGHTEHHGGYYVKFTALKASHRLQPGVTSDTIEPQFTVRPQPPKVLGAIVQSSGA